MNQRTKVGGAPLGQKLLLIVVALAIILLIVMISTAKQPANLVMPITPLVPTAMPSTVATAIAVQPNQPTPIFDTVATEIINPSPVKPSNHADFRIEHAETLPPQRYYLERQKYDQDAPFVVAYDQQFNPLFQIDLTHNNDLFRPRYLLDSLWLNADGSRLIIARGDGLSAIDTTNGLEVWHTSGIITNTLANYYHWFTPDQTKLVVGYSDGLVNHLTVLDLATGAVQSEFQVATGYKPIGVDNQQRLWFVTYQAVLIVALDQTTSTVPLDFQPTIAAITPNGSQAWLFSYDQFVIIDTVTLQTQQDRGSVRLTDFAKLIPAPDSSAFLVCGNVRLLSEVQNGAVRDKWQTYVYLVDQASTYVLAEPLDRIDCNLMWSSDSSHFYALEESTIIVANRQADVVNSLQYAVPKNSSGISAVVLDAPLTIAPYVAWNPISQPTLTPMPTPDPYALRNDPPPPLNLVEADPRDFVWIRDLGNAQIMACQRDGVCRTEASNIIKVLPRTSQKPLLVNLDQTNAWQVYDPESKQAIRLGDNPPKGEFEAILSPDEQQIAIFIKQFTESAASTWDELLIVNLASNMVTTHAKPSDDQLFRGAQLVAWRDQSLYFVQDDQTPDQIRRGDALKLFKINRLDLTSNTPENLDTFVSSSTYFVGITPQTHWLISEYYNDTEAQIQLLNLQTREKRIISYRPFINIRDILVAPNGEQIAFLRPADKLAIYTISIDTTISHQLLWDRSRVNSLAWLADSSGLMLTYISFPHIRQIIPSNDQAVTTNITQYDWEYLTFSNNPANPAFVSIENVNDNSILRWYPSVNAEQPAISLLLPDKIYKFDAEIVYVGE